MLHRTRLAVVSVAVTVLLLFSGVLAAPAALAAGGTVGISQNLTGGGSSNVNDITLPSGGSFSWTVNFTCNSDTCHDGVIKLNFPSWMTPGSSNYAPSEVSRVVKSSTQVTYVMNPDLPVGTSSQIVLQMATTPWSTPDGAVGSLTTQFTTSDGENVTTSPSTVTSRAGNTTQATLGTGDGVVSGGIGSFSTSTCVNGTSTPVVGPLGLAPGSTYVVTYPAGTSVYAAEGATVDAANRTMTWTSSGVRSGCTTYTYKLNISRTAYPAGSQVSITATLNGANVGISGSTTLASDARSYPVGQAVVTPPTTVRQPSAGSIPMNQLDGQVMGHRMQWPKTATQSADSVVDTESLPVNQIDVTSVSFNNPTTGPAIGYVKTFLGADGVAGTADDGSWIAVTGTIAPGNSLTATAGSPFPNGFTLPAGDYLTDLKLEAGGLAPGADAGLLSYEYNVRPTYRDGTAAAVGDVIGGSQNISWTEHVDGIGTVNNSETRSGGPVLIATPPPPNPFLTTRIALTTINNSATLDPGERSFTITPSYYSGGAGLDNPVYFLFAPEGTHADLSTLAVTGNAGLGSDPTVDTISNFTAASCANKSGTLYRLRFPAGETMTANAFYSFAVTMQLEDTLMGNPRFCATWASSTNNTYSAETQWWGTWSDTAADLDLDGLAGASDPRIFPMFFTDVVPARSLSVALTQSVKGSWDTSYQAGPATGYSTPGANDSYRVSVTNRGTVAMDDATVIATLPRPGDTQVLSGGQRSPAASTFPVLLTSVPVLPAGMTGATVSYTTATGFCKPELGYSPTGCVSAAWTTTPPSDLTTVTGLKIAFGANLLNPGRSWNVDMTVTTPTSGATEPDFAVSNPQPNSPSTDEKARGSSAYRIREAGTSNYLNAAESPNVTLAMPGVYGPVGAPPSPNDVTSTGAGTAPQQANLQIPPQGSVTLLDANAQPATTVTMPGQGTYTIDPQTGVVTFQPVPGFLGTADPVLYRVTNVFGQRGIATYTATVTAPGAPSAVPVGIAVPQNSAGGSTTVAVPPGGSASLIDGNGALVSTLTVPGEGTYSIDPQTGRISFAPDPTFSGTATPIGYAVTDAYGQQARSTATFSVVPATSPTPQTSSGYNSADPAVAATPQSVTVSAPSGVTMQMRDPRTGTSVTSYAVARQGTYTFDPATGAIAFVPEFGFAGSPEPVTVAFVDGFGQVGTSTYTPNVLAPAPPPIGPIAGPGGVGTAPQTIPITPPVQGRIDLVDAQGNAAQSVVVPGEGTYSVDPLSGTVTFQPALGFHGQAAGVAYRATDAYGQPLDSRIATTVTVPAPPTAQGGRTRGVGTAPQRFLVALPPGGHVELQDLNGSRVSTLAVVGQGTYTVEGDTIVFVAAPGYSGTSFISFAVVDAYGQDATALLTSTTDPVPVVLSMLGVTGIEGGPWTPLGMALLGAGLALIAATRLRRRSTGRRADRTIRRPLPDMP